MSLLLRKQCQSMLDGVGLQNYHTQIDPESKMLQIVGECGQDFVSIAGIRLSRMAPNDKEIALAIELFEAFLVKHTGTFKGFIAAKTAADNTCIPQSVDALMGSRVTKQTYKEYHELKFTMSGIAGSEIIVKSTGEVSIPQIKVDLQFDDEKIMTSALTEAEAQAIVLWVSACTEYTIATNEKNALRNKLSSCEI